MEKRLNLNNTRVTPSLQTTTDRIPTNGLMVREIVVIVHMFPATLAGEVTIILEMFVSKLDLISGICCMTHCSQAIVQTN